jgi:phosphatidylserine synthase
LLKNESFAQVGFPGLLTACYALFISGIVLVNLEATLGTAELRLLLCTTVPVLSLLMVSRIRYPKLTVSKSIGIPVVIFLLCLPLVLTKLLATLMLGVVAAYAVVSPLLIRHSRQRTDGKPVGRAGW